MAFMMPVMKNNMSLYTSGAAAGTVATKQKRRTSDTDAGKRSISKAQAIGIQGANRRKVRSEGPSLSTSPGSGTISVNPQANLQVPHMRGGSRPLPMARVRGSAPVLGATAMPLHRHNSMPHGPHPVVGSAPNKPSSPTRSDSSSSSSENATPVSGKFHLKLIARLRRSLRIKDPSTPTPEPAATTA